MKGANEEEKFRRLRRVFVQVQAGGALECGRLGGAGKVGKFSRPFFRVFVFNIEMMWI
jgi:hypothetical protein